MAAGAVAGGLAGLVSVVKLEPEQQVRLHCSAEPFRQAVLELTLVALQQPELESRLW